MIVRFITVSSDPEAEARLARSLDPHQGAELYMRCTEKIGAQAAIRSGLVDAVIVVGAPPWFDRQLADEAREHGLGLVGIASDPFEADELLGLGCILAPGEADPATILAAASSPSSTIPRSDEGGGGFTVAVCGPKGAPGVTSIAVELAFVAAAGLDEVALVDADTHGPSCIQALGVEEEIPSLVWMGRACLRRESGEPIDVWEGFRRLGRNGPVLLPGIPHPGVWTDLSSASWMAVLKTVRERFAATVFDVGTDLEADVHAGLGVDGRNHIARSTVSSADNVLCVADGSAIGLRRLLDLWPSLVEVIDGQAPLLVINRIDPAAAGEIKRLCGSELGHEPDLFLLHSRSLAKARKAGRAALELYPRSGAVESLRGLGERLWGGTTRSGLLTRLAGRR